MNIKEITAYIAQHEGLKSETSVGNIREILKILAVLFVNDADARMSFLNYGIKQKKAKKKTK